MKVLIAPGAFKHSLSPVAAAQAIQRGLARSGFAHEAVLLPIADGGNGTLEVALSAFPDATRHTITVRDPLGRPIRADYGLFNNGKSALIEMAQASGLERLAASELNAVKASTYGTGELLRHALEQGIQQIVVGLGGSATTDGGAGALTALGVRLLDANGRVVIPQGAHGLARVAAVDLSRLDPRWSAIEVILATDVDNPAVGERGAAAIFAPQKGARSDEIPVLDAALTAYLSALGRATGRDDLLTLSGGGAAGAIAAGLVGGLNAHITSGIEYTLGLIGFAEHLHGAGLVITGEGRMDEQTIGGKGPFGVALTARAAGVPTIALVGGLGVADAVLHEAGLAAVFPIVDQPMPLEQALARAPELLERAALRLGYVLQLRV
jgi:glycerate kinase